MVTVVIKDFGTRSAWAGGAHLPEVVIGGDTDDLSLDLIVTETIASDGSDNIIGGDANDVIFGGGSDAGALPKQDTIFGDFDPGAPLTGPRPSGQDVIVGDGGRVDFLHRMLRDGIENRPSV